MVGATGIEPVTSCTSSMHSNLLSYASTDMRYYTTSAEKMQEGGEMFFYRTLFNTALIKQAPKWCIIKPQ